MVRKIVKGATLALTAVALLLMGMVGYLDWELPDDYYVSEPSSFRLSQYSFLTVHQRELALPAVRTSANAVSKEASLKLGGVIPVKTVSVHQTEKQYLVPCGTPFGLKMLTDGVLVVGLSPVETASGVQCPAQAAGLQKGDLICRVNGESLSSFQQLANAVSSGGGQPIGLTVRRDEAEISLSVQPVQSLSGAFQCGIWGRDSSAGIGTVTFYDPATGAFGGLGHGVCDADTGSLMPLGSGEIVPAAILDVVPGTAGSPGELRGSFTAGLSSGILLENTSSGVFGLLRSAPVHQTPVEVCPRQEVMAGPAEILCTLSGGEPSAYDIEIEKVSYLDGGESKNMVIRVTDPDLLAVTGGIVQGMSGSPILQSGRLVGAVTHVFVNDPQRGYGIFAEKMTEELTKIAGQKDELPA